MFEGKDGILDIGYSRLGGNAGNTVEHFMLAAKFDYDGLKADVRMTRDGIPVLCHDEGYTFIRPGYIGKFNKDNFVKIGDMDYNDLIKNVHAEINPDTATHPRIATLDDFLKICAENGKLAYITLRENRIVETADAVFSRLDEYGMKDKCIINSFTREVLKEVRRRSDTIPVSHVFKLNTVFTKDIVRKVAELENSVATQFCFAWAKNFEACDESREGYEEAHRLGLPIHMAQVWCPEDRERLINEYGFTGFQLKYHLHK